MIFLLDTNVISEGWKPTPDKNVLKWRENARCRIPSPVIAEIAEGAEKHKSASRRRAIRAQLEILVNAMPENIVDWDGETAMVWGMLRHSPEVKRQPQSLWDSLIDALAVRHGFTVATRNTGDFRHAETFNPWTFSENAAAE